MESDGRAFISDGGPQAAPFQAIKSLGAELDWPVRIKICSRRCAAALIDVLFISALSLFFLGFPLGASVSFSIWEPATATAPTWLSGVIEHGLQFAAVLTFLTQLYFYTALWECGPAQASLGKILMGLKTSDSSGNRQTFAAVLRRLNVKYALFIGLCALAYYLTSVGADFIASLRIEMVRMVFDSLIVVASFVLCLVTDRQQTLYDMVSGRLVVPDQASSWKERVANFASALRGVFRGLNPVAADGKNLSSGAGITALTLRYWTYVCAASAILFLVFASRIGMALSEVESGVRAQQDGQSRQGTAVASEHFHKALALAPGISVIYQNYYMFNENTDLAKQEAACTRLFALRGNAQDYLYRARIYAKQQQYKAAEIDYTTALSADHGSLAPEELSAAKTELVMIRLEEEAAKMQASPSYPLHTTPFDLGPPGSHLK